MPSGKKRKRHKVATHKRKKERELTVIKRKKCKGIHSNKFSCSLKLCNDL